MKKLLIFLLVAIALASCSGIRKSINSGGGEVTGVGATTFSEPTPYGMVLIDCGSMKEGPAQRDSLWGIDSTARGVSVDAFWMDENEVTNSKYKQFLYWVRDSIIRERLADPAYGGNEEFKIEEDKDGNPITPHLNWNRNIPWKNPSEDEERAIESVYRVNPITGKKELDPRQMNYRYEIYNLTEAAKRRNRFDPTTRDYNTDHAVPTTNPTISKDTAFVDDDGRIIRQTITRTLQSEYDFVNTYIVNIFPDTTCWINDFENSYNEPYVRLYFANGNYNNHPVVGVSWEQANAFCHWRTEFLKKSLGKDGRRTTALSFAAGIPGGVAGAVTIPADLVQFYGYLIRAIQKLTYLYGWRDLAHIEAGVPDRAASGALVVMLGVMAGNEQANAVLARLARLRAAGASDQTLRTVFTEQALADDLRRISDDLTMRMAKRLGGQVAGKAIPIVGGIVSGVITGSGFDEMAKQLLKQLKLHGA